MKLSVPRWSSVCCRNIFPVSIFVGLSASVYAGFETYKAEGFHNPVPIEGADGASVAGEGGSAVAQPGLLKVDATATRISLAGGSNAGSEGSGDASYLNTRFLLDPAWVGQLGVVNVVASAGSSAAGSLASQGDFVTRNGGTAAASFDAAGQYGNVQATSYDDTPTADATSFAGEVPILAGQVLALFASARAGASVNYYGLGGSASSGASASLAFEIVLTEDRLHWTAGNGVMPAGSTVPWAESLSLNSTRYAVFNDEAGRNLSLSLSQNQEWRGLVVDGETVALNLGGHTLTLGADGPSVIRRNLLLGEGRGGTSQLTLSNGTAKLAYDLVAGREATTPGTLILENAAALRENENGISAYLGVRGAGTLAVRGGSTLQVSQVSLGGDVGGVGGAEVTGSGSRLETVGLFVGQKGDGALAVRDGAVVQASLIHIAEKSGATGTLTVEGAGSRLELVPIPNAAVFVGAEAGSRGTLEVKGGAALAGESIAFTVGSGDAADFSVFRVQGAGTTLTEAGINVRAGGVFQLSDGASWNEGGLVLRGGEARIQNNATARLGNRVSVGPAVEGGQIKKTGLLTIAGGGTLEAGADMTVEGGGAVSVNGTGSRLTGFTTLFLQGSLNVSNGGKVIASPGEFGPGEIILQRGGVLSGSGGAIEANVFVSDGAQLRPGNSPGTLTIEGDLAVAAGAKLQLEIGGTTPGSLYDRLFVNGDAIFADGAIIEFVFVDGFAPEAGQLFSFFEVGGDFDLAETFFTVAGLEEGWEYSTLFDPENGGLTLQALSDGVAAAIPEPASLTLGLGVAVVLVAGLRRRPAAARA